MSTSGVFRRLCATGVVAALITTGLVLGHGEAAQAATFATCQNQDSLDWASLPDRSSPTTATGDGVTYDISRVDNAPATGSPTPPQVDFATVKSAVQGNRSGYYSLAMDPRNRSDHEELILTPDSPVAGFELTLLDVDIRTDGGNYRDVAVVSASLRGAPVTAVPSALGSAVAYSTRADGAAVVTGVAPAANTTEDANATLAFPSPVDRIVIRYETGEPPLGGTNPTQQLIGIDDFRWCGLSAGTSKSVSGATFDDGRYAVTYEYTLQNNGGPVGVDPQIEEDLAARFGTYVAGTPTTRGTYTVGTPSIVTNSATPVSLNPAFTGSGEGRGVLAPGVGALGAGEKVVVRVPVTFLPSALPFSTTNQVTGSLDYFGNDDGTPQKDQTDRSTNGGNPDADGDGRADDDDATTPLTVRGTPAIDLTVTDDAGGRARPGEPVVFTYTATNRGDIPLTDVRIGDATPTLTCTPAQPAALAVGARLVCTGTRTVTDPDVTRGSLIETPTVTAQSTVRAVDARGTDTVPVTANPTAQPDTSNGEQGTEQRIDPLANDTPGATALPLDPASLRLIDGGGAPVERRTVPGEGTYAIDRTQPARPVVVFTPEPGFAGSATPVTYRVDDSDGGRTTSTITPSVVSQPPAAASDTSTGLQGATQRVDPLANDTPGRPAAPLDPATFTLLDGGGAPVTSVTVPGQGVYTVESGPQGPRIVFTPGPEFVGSATPVSYRVADSGGATATSTYTPTVTAVTPVAAADKGESRQGTPVRIPVLTNDQPGDPSVPLVTTSVTLLDPNGSPVSRVPVPGQGTYTIETGQDGPTAVFTPEPGFSGSPTPVDYRVADRNGTTSTAKISPRIVAVTPTATPDVTTGPQGRPQQIDVSANDTPGDAGVPLVPSSVTLLDAAGAPATRVVIDDVGTYTRGDGGTIVFTPLPAFTGAAPAVSYRIADANGTTAQSTYAPAVLSVEPTASPDTTTGPQGMPQQIDVSLNDAPGSADVPLVPSSVELLNETGDPVTRVVVDGAGTYTRGEGGVLVSTPLPEFTGAAPAVSYRIADANGTFAESTYTPTVTAAPRGPNAVPDTTSGPQGAPQQIDVSLNDTPGEGGAPIAPFSVVLLDTAGTPVPQVAIDGVGTYTRGANGIIVFTPVPAFTGTAPPVTYWVADTAGRSARSTYTPTVTAVAPTASPDTTTGPQGKPQQIDVSLNDTAGSADVPLVPSSVELLDGAGKPVTEVVVDGAGTYTRGDGGVVVFTPLPEFTGTAPAVSYRIADANGTFAASTYTPSVTPAPGSPVAVPDTSSGPQGSPQSVDPLANDRPSSPGSPLVPSTLGLIDKEGDVTGSVPVPNVGEYTIDGPDDAPRIVFTPEPSFTGPAPSVTYQVSDPTGATGTSTYTPTVIAVTPTASPDTTTGPQGAPQQIDVSVNDTAGSADVPLDPSSVELLDAAGKPVTEVVVDGAGTYTRGAGGVIVFTPLPAFTGTAPAVPYRIADANGTIATSTYTPSVTPVSVVTPTASPDATTGPQGTPQQIDVSTNDAPGDPAVPLVPTSVELLDGAGKPVAQIVIDGVGTYTRGDGGVIVFTPEPAFVGSAPAARYRIADANGKTAESAYVPTVTPTVTPTPTPTPAPPVSVPDTSSGGQGEPQTTDPLSNDRPGDPGVPFDASSVVLIDRDGSPTGRLEIPGIGVFEVESGGSSARIRFFPDPEFFGTTPDISYRVTDRNGRTSTSTYTATVTPKVPAPPTTPEPPVAPAVPVAPALTPKSDPVRPGGLATTGGGPAPVGLGAILLLSGLVLALWRRRRGAHRDADERRIGTTA